MSNDLQNPTPTTIEERDKVHESLAEALEALKAEHPKAMFTVQVATVDVQRGEGYDVLTLFSHKEVLPMFLQALGDTILTMTPKRDRKIIAPH